MYESKEYDSIFQFLVKVYSGVEDKALVPDRIKAMGPKRVHKWTTETKRQFRVIKSTDPESFY